MSRDFEFDFRQVAEFRDRIEALAKSDLDNFIKLATNELAGELMRLAVNKTPVDSGELRRRWRMTRVKKISNGYEVRVINPVEYASFVEKGHRQKPGRYVPAIGKKLKKSFVPGKFFLKKSEIELESNSRSLIENKLRRFLEDTLNA